MRAAVTIGLLLQSSLLSAVRADCTGFKSDAGDYVSAGYYTKNLRGGRTKTVYTKAEVSLQFDQMLDDLNCYDLAAPQLMMRDVAGPADGWTDVGSDPKTRRGKSVWTFEVKPCLQYAFKISLNSNSLDGEGVDLELPSTVGPATDEELEESGQSLFPQIWPSLVQTAKYWAKNIL